MHLDDKFFRELKIHVRPEELVDEKIWQEWFEALSRTPSFEKKVIQVAKSKNFPWPPSYFSETIGQYLKLKFSVVKKSIGWDAKRTLLLCIAEEYRLCIVRKRNVSKREDVSEDLNDKRNQLDIVAKKKNIENECVNVIEIIDRLTESNKFHNDLIVSLRHSIETMRRENKTLIDRNVSNNINDSHLKQLLDDVINLSQNQIIDIDELNRENRLLKAEIESYRQKHEELKNKYEKIHSCGHSGLARKITFEKEEKFGNLRPSNFSEHNSKVNINRKNEVFHKNRIPEGGSSPSRDVYDADDIKI